MVEYTGIFASLRSGSVICVLFLSIARRFHGRDGHSTRGRRAACLGGGLSTSVHGHSATRSDERYATLLCGLQVHVSCLSYTKAAPRYVSNLQAKVACHCNMSKPSLFHASPHDNGGILPLSTIENSLQECDERAKQTPNQLELGWLTTSNRNDWAHAHKQLLRIGGQDMERALNDLESGMLVLCLDNDEPVSYRQRALEYLHGGMQSGGNRWFDKSIQLVVSRNGKLGYIGEHSMMDGMPAVGLCQHLKTESYAKQKASQKNTLSASCTRGVVNLFQEACSNLTCKVQRTHLKGTKPQGKER
jgi:hypothetical protein